MAKLTTFEQLKAALVKIQNGVAEVADAAADALEELDDAKADKVSFGTLTIPASGWNTDSAVPGFTKYIDISVAGITSNDCIAVTVHPYYSDIARAAEFTATETLAGKLRLRCKKVPSAAMSAQYYVIR